MKKTIYILMLSSIFIISCEKDDICTQNPITPNLILRLYDIENTTTLKSVSNLSVWVTGKDSIYKNESTDSIVLPINSESTETIYNLYDGTNINTFTISYTPEVDYVSRSCGFRVIYNDVEFTSNHTWITFISPEKLSTIDNQTAAHVKIFH